MNSFNITACLDKIRKHIDYDYINDSGQIIALKKSSLVEFLSHINKNEHALVVGETNGNASVPLLSDAITNLLVAFLQLFKDMFAANLCLPKFDENDLVLHFDEGIPKLRQHLVFEELSEAGKDNNVKWLRELIDGVILAGCHRTDEVQDFLGQFKSDGSKNFELIIVHSAVVPVWQKIDYFCDSHDFLLDYVKELDPAAYSDIMNGLEFPADWEMKVPNNSHLETSYCNRDPVWRSRTKKAQLQNSTGLSALNQPVQPAAGNAAASSSQSSLNPPVSLSAPALVPSKVQANRSASLKTPKRAVTYKGKSTNPGVLQWQIKTPQPSSTQATTSLAGPPLPPGPNPQQPPLAKPKTYNRPGTLPAEEVMKYNRNTGTHGGNDAVKNQQIQYSVKDLSVMLLYYFPKLLCSVLKGLHRKGWLSRMETLPRVVR